MTERNSSQYLAGFGLAFVVATVPSLAHACMLVSEKPVVVSGEEVLLVWDEATKTEELIRYIDFRGEAESFGFVVPTPSEPTVRELKSRTVFEVLTGVYRATNSGMKGARVRGIGEMGSGDGAGEGVQVVSRVNLPAAGQTATVLAADDAGALDAWLAKHGYPSSPALKAYYQPYVNKGFFFTAFQYTKGKAPHSRGAVVSLTFKSDAMFFPYAEPKGNQPSRPFRLSVLAGEPVVAKVGPSRWPAQVGFRDRIATRTKYEILNATNGELPGDRWFLTTFDEPKSRRGRRDLRFTLERGAKAVPARLKTIIGARVDYVY
ncbi:MAG: DUF2330 domain-containing protein [Myxococcota bacterium]